MCCELKLNCFQLNSGNTVSGLFYQVGNRGLCGDNIEALLLFSP